MTDWNAWLLCPVCDARKGHACETRSAFGPEALPTLYADVPHSTRKPAAGTAEAAARTPQTPQPRTAARTANPARRQAKRTAAQVTSWQQVADRQIARRK